MCGICGELRLDGSRPDAPAVRRMAARLARRGPDHEGYLERGPLALAHRRLSIIDLSHHSDQPMQDAALGLSLVFNGTIYNYHELRAELQQLGYQFFSEGDTEVILKAYHAWGAACVPRFYGMFAFAIWNGHTLFMARDRFGIKPLYYSLDAQRLRFASTLPALLAGGEIDTSLNPTALHFHFTLHSVVPAPHTLLNGVNKLPPAHHLTLTPGQAPHWQRYWQLDATRPPQVRSEGEWLEETRLVLARAVERHRLASDVPVGILLSGGLDSSLLVGLLADHVTNLNTFAIGFEAVGGEVADEFVYSDLVAQHYGTRHHRYAVPNSAVLQHLPDAIAEMSEPMPSYDVTAFYLLAQHVAPHVKVVLAGQGADEVFGGYFWYPRMQATSGTPLQRFAAHYFDRDHPEWLDMLTCGGPDASSAWVAQQLQQPLADEFLDQVFRLDITSLMVDDPVKRVDNMTMAWGLEARVPFLDHELVELAARMPPALKLRDGGKYPLKAVARGLIPDAVIDRPKGYFPVPALKYLRGDFLEQMRALLDSHACRQRGLYRRDYVQRLLAAPDAHLTRIQGSKLWHLALLEWWLQVQVDGVK